MVSRRPILIIMYIPEVESENKCVVSIAISTIIDVLYFFQTTTDIYAIYTEHLIKYNYD